MVVTANPAANWKIEIRKVEEEYFHRAGSIGMAVG
jgi:hypothetical protein